MTLTIDLPPELEARLRDEAARAGLEPDSFVRSALEERLREAKPRVTGSPSQLSRNEAALLQKINQGLPPAMWQRYHELVAKRRAETLTADEQAELIALSDRIEIANAQRLGYLVELARLRHTSLEALMDQLGIRSPGYA